MSNLKQSKKTNHFVIFPLNSLSLNVSYKFLINCLIDYYIISKIKDITDYKLKYLICEKYLADVLYLEYPEIQESFSEINEELLKNKLNNFKMVIYRYKIIKKQNDLFIKKYNGNDAFVKVHINLLNDIILKNALTERQFRILCAIYSKIGVSEYQIIYNDEIRIRAFGYRNNKIYNEEIKRTNRKKSLFSNKTLKTEITKLKFGELGRNFFDRVSDGRKYYYSSQSRGKKLEDYVLSKKMQNHFRRIEENTRNNNIRNKCIELRYKTLNEKEMAK